MENNLKINLIIKTWQEDYCAYGIMMFFYVTQGCMEGEWKDSITNIVIVNISYYVNWRRKKRLWKEIKRTEKSHNLKYIH